MLPQQTSSFFSILVKRKNYNTATLQVKLKDKLYQQSYYKKSNMSLSQEADSHCQQ